MNAKTLLMVLGIALWMPVFLVLCSLSGCQAGTTGLLRPIDTGVEHTITNTIGQVTGTAGQVAPAPFGAAIEAAGAAVLALLAVWQGLTHSRVNQIQTLNVPKEKDTAQ